MELKGYQKDVIKDLEGFLLQYHIHQKDLKKAFEKHWEAKGVPMLSTENLKGQRAYGKNVGEVPHVCIKVPTAGGKTFLATNAIRTIFDNVEGLEHQAVVWLVPSNTILDQTYNNLNNPEHPYRQKLNVLFGSRVNILSKGETIQGIDFNPTTVKENLSVMVLSFDSLRSRKKTDRLIFRENGNLKQFFDLTADRSFLLDDGLTDEESLINVIRYLNPVVVIDESHRAASDLSVETLKALNPSFILDLTATPRNNSNIISIIGAERLKAENMVKLPIVVYNQKTKNDVIVSALTLQRKLELQAIALEEQGGKYIRPIVLFQAEPKSKADTQTFEKIKKDLIESGIPEEYIAIKTADINELSKHDLMSRDCKIRYIITVNALKEGWDCPFAYILATVANRSSVIDVEQVVGRVLRQPYVHKHKDPLLNMSYVFTSSAKFQDTLKKIVEALNAAGFSSNDFRVAQNEMEKEEENKPKDLSDFLNQPGVQQEMFGGIETGVEEIIDEVEEIKDIDTSVIKQSLADLAGNKVLEAIETFATQVNEGEKAAIENKKGNEIDDEIKKMSNVYKMNVDFEAIASAIRLPQFYQKEAMSDIFGGEQVLLDKEALKAKCKLGQQDTIIDFDSIDYEIYKIDIEQQGNDYVARQTKMNRQFNDYFVEYVTAKTGDEQAKSIASGVVSLLGKMPPFSEQDLTDYVFRIVQSMDVSKRNELLSNYKWIAKIKRKINQIADDFVVGEFKKQLNTDEIIVKETYELPTEINPIKTSFISKGLYEKEATGNNFENDLISKISSLDNVLFWHRIDEKKRNQSFYLNGYLNHYPDFLVYTKSGKIVIIEGKGDHLDGSDSALKLQLGKLWENQSRIFGNKYAYFMVFQHSPITNAHSLDEFISDIMGKL
jgi:type III restriction enzyme